MVECECDNYNTANHRSPFSACVIKSGWERDSPSKQNVLTEGHPHNETREQQKSKEHEKDKGHGDGDASGE